jgi:superfamily I DNA/RNA helicase
VEKLRLEATEEQRAICLAARDIAAGSSLKVQAFAGTGKTTTLAAVAESLPHLKFLYLVFNRAAAQGAKQRMPPNVTVRTAHAVAFRKVGHIYKSRLATSVWAWFPYLKEKMPRALDSVVSLGRDSTSAGALIIRTVEQFLRTTDVEVWPKHAPYWCDGNLAGAISHAAEALWRNICKPQSSAPVTHDCYLKLFYLHGYELAPRDWTVMLDEAQDADPVIFALVERHKGPRMIVGDKYQQLYQWRGAINALTNVNADSPELSLTQTFRFGPDAAQWANRVLAVLGEKSRIAPANHRTNVTVEDRPVSINALLARTNAGTLEEAIRGLGRKRKVHVMGGASALIRLIRAAWDLYRGKSGSGELAMFNNWEELKAAARGEKNGSVGDPALQVLVHLVQDRGRKVLTMCRQLEACVDSAAGAQITVSTVHKAKGLEWNRVFLSDDFNQFVEREHGKPLLNPEEAYVVYVALTRARDQLVIHPACVDAIEASEGAKVGICRDHVSPSVSSRPVEFRLRRNGRQIAPGELST